MYSLVPIHDKCVLLASAVYSKYSSLACIKSAIRTHLGDARQLLQPLHVYEIFCDPES